MLRIADFVIGVTDLLRSEARELKENALRIAVTLTVLAVAAALWVGVLGLGLAALCVGLAGVMPAGWALLITAGALLLLALGVTAMAAKIARARQHG